MRWLFDDRYGNWSQRALDPGEEAVVSCRASLNGCDGDIQYEFRGRQYRSADGGEADKTDPEVEGLTMPDRRTIRQVVTKAAGLQSLSDVSEAKQSCGNIESTGTKKRCYSAVHSMAEGLQKKVPAAPLVKLIQSWAFAEIENQHLEAIEALDTLDRQIDQIVDESQTDIGGDSGSLDISLDSDVAALAEELGMSAKEGADGKTLELDFDTDGLSETDGLGTIDIDAIDWSKESEQLGHEIDEWETEQERIAAQKRREEQARQRRLAREQAAREARLERERRQMAASRERARQERQRARQQRIDRNVEMLRQFSDVLSNQNSGFTDSSSGYDRNSTGSSRSRRGSSCPPGTCANAACYSGPSEQCACFTPDPGASCGAK